MVLASGFYQTFQRGQAELVDAAIDRIEPQGVRTADGRLHDVDVIVLATGFDAHSYLRPVELIGPGGLRLSQEWGYEPHGYRTVAVPGFPNFFLLVGPHSPIGNQSVITITETQVAYVMAWIQRWRQGSFDSAAPPADATKAFNDEITGAFTDTVWASGCDSYYLTTEGTPLVWPYAPRRHREMLAEPQLAEWDLQPGCTVEVGGERGS